MLIKVTKKNPIFKVELLFISNVEYNKLISKENMTAKGLQHKVCEEELPPPPSQSQEPVTRRCGYTESRILPLQLR